MYRIHLQISNAAAGILGKSQVVDQTADAASTHASNSIYSLGNGCLHAAACFALPHHHFRCHEMG
jgi:hypothetical protein